MPWWSRSLLWEMWVSNPRKQSGQIPLQSEESAWVLYAGGQTPSLIITAIQCYLFKVELEEDPDSKVLELKLKALILETLHYIDIVESLSEGRVRSTDHWLWKKQLRWRRMSQHHNCFGQILLGPWWKGCCADGGCWIWVHIRVPGHLCLGFQLEVLKN